MKLIIHNSLLLVNKIENIFGYGKSVEYLVSHVYGIFFYRKIKHFLRKKIDKKVIMISLGLPGYINNISPILEELSNDKYVIVIFPEWGSDSEAYDRQLRRHLKPDYKVFYNCSRVMPLLSASVFLSSIAGKKFYFPKKCKRLFYFHSVSGLDGFPSGGLDAYDIILAATAQQVDQLKLRYGSSKRIISAGYPKFDNIIARLKNHECKIQNRSGSTIIFAPSFSDEKIYKDVSIFSLSAEIIELLLAHNYKVIFRPHPLFLKKEKDREFIEQIITRFGADIEFDDNSDYFDSYISSSGMLTDVSGTSLIYRAAFDRPVLFFTPRPDLAVRAFSLIECIGELIQKLDDIPLALEKMLEGMSSLNQSDLVFSIGSSAEIFIDEIERAAA